MLRTIALTSMAAVAVGAATPGASASDAVYSCQLLAFRDPPLTAQVFVGPLTGDVSSPSGGTVGIRCSIRVNAVTITATNPASGVATAAVSDVVSFIAERSDTIDVCATVTDHAATATQCVPTNWAPVPPWIEVVHT